MKKLLSLLGALTISGTAVPTTIADSPYQKEENNKKYIITKILGINQRISSIAIDSISNVYYGSEGGNVYKLKNNEITVLKINGVENNSRIESTVVDSQNNVYFATSSGAYVLKKGTNHITKINEIKDYVWLTLVDSKDNVYFVSNKNGVYKFISNENKTEKIHNIIGKVLTFIIDKNDNKFYWIQNKGIFLLKNNENKPIKICGIKKYYGYLTFIDNNNNLYIGSTNKNGYSLYVIKNNENWGTKIKNINTQVRSITADNNNNIYIGTNNQGAFLLSNTELFKEKPKAKQINELETNYGINSIVVDNNNNVYFGLHLIGLYIIENNTNIPRKINEINSSVFIIKIDNINNKVYVSAANYTSTMDNEYRISS